MENVWSFVEANYPNYSSADEILINEDLKKIVEGDISGSAKQLFKKIKADLKEEYLNIHNSYMEKPFLRVEALKIAEQLFDKSSAEIYEKSIKAFLNREQEKTYYIFGESAVNAYHNNKVEAFLKDDLNSFGKLIFIEGVTKSVDIVEAIDGWITFVAVTEEVYKQFNK